MTSFVVSCIILHSTDIIYGMDRIIECIPNFSEGRDEKVLSALQKAAGGTLMDIHKDADHNRSVFTMAGSPQAIYEAAFAMAALAVQLIDLRKHSGEHPRMGAVDVIPLVPIKNVEMSDCIAMAQQLGKKISKDLALPVFLYEEAATAPERRNLADIRKQGWKEWQADFPAPAQTHPSAGAVAIGARKPLIAYNINLNTDDINIAKAIAKSIRGSSGGLPHCKALGMYLKERNIAQVSMNLTDHEQTPIHQVFEAVQTEAARHNTSILESELVGLAPASAILTAAKHYLKLPSLNPQHILELKIEDLKD